MSVFVKICGLRDASTVAAAIDSGADAIGFVFAESPRQVSVDEAMRAACDVPATIKRVAVMRHPSAEEWNEVRDGFAPDVLQTDIGDFAILDVPDNIATWPVIREGENVASWPATFVYEGMQSGAGETVDWSRAGEVGAKGKMILAGGLESGNVATAIKTARPFGVDVSSGVESTPGIKDPALIREFINAVRNAEKEG